MYDIEKIREDFPILGRTVYGHPLVYLDNGATTQKPRCVVDSMVEEYYNVNANVHRGVHFLSQQATELHEQSRETVRRFINAKSTSEIVFTRGTTESINLVATCFGEYLRTAKLTDEGFEVIISIMEHHSNLVPWQMMCERWGGTLRVIPMTDDGDLDMEAYAGMFNEKTRIVAVTHVSNVLGTVSPVKKMIAVAHEHNVPILIDGAQSSPHMRIDVQAMDCDFFAFSGHKTYGPTGIGVLYGKEEWLDRMPPYMGGGEMIKTVTIEKTTFNELPFKFEAGTPDYIASTGLAKALDYITALGMDNILRHEQQLTRYAIDQMMMIPHMLIYGGTPLLLNPELPEEELPAEAQTSAAAENAQAADDNSPKPSFIVKHYSDFSPAQPEVQQVIEPVTHSILSTDTCTHDAVISFQVGEIHHLDLGTLLDRLGIAIRTGHHCTEPLMTSIGIQGTARVSFGLYNTKAEIDALCEAIDRVRKMF